MSDNIHYAIHYIAIIQKYTIYENDSRRDASLRMRVCKEITK